MSDNNKQYDSVLIGWAEDPKYNEEGNIQNWKLKLKDTELKDILENYCTKRNENGEGGNAFISLFVSKNGKACASVWNPYSEKAQEARENKKAAAAVNSQTEEEDELPF